MFASTRCAYRIRSLRQVCGTVRGEKHPFGQHGFFLAWPRLDLASKLVLNHADTWDGRHYGALAPAADALDEPHPAAATVLYRALIDDILARARSPAYGHAARYFARLDALAERVG